MLKRVEKCKGMHLLSKSQFSLILQIEVHSVTVILLGKIFFTPFTMYLLPGDTFIEYFMVATVRLLLQTPVAMGMQIYVMQ